MRNSPKSIHVCYICTSSSSHSFCFTFFIYI